MCCTQERLLQGLKSRTRWQEADDEQFARLLRIWWSKDADAKPVFPARFRGGSSQTVLSIYINWKPAEVQFHLVDPRRFAGNMHNEQKYLCDMQIMIV